MSADEGISDLQILEAIRKGTFWLKLKKLRALEFIAGPLPLKLHLTKDGLEEIQRITKEPHLRSKVPDPPHDPNACVWSSPKEPVCNRRRLKGLTMCRKHQPFPAKT